MLMRQNCVSTLRWLKVHCLSSRSLPCITPVAVPNQASGPPYPVMVVMTHEVANNSSPTFATITQETPTRHSLSAPSGRD